MYTIKIRHQSKHFLCKVKSYLCFGGSVVAERVRACLCSCGGSGESAGVVVRRAGRGAGRGAAGQLLADAGDGAEADLLGSTPPRARIRDKEKRRYRATTIHISELIFATVTYY